MSALVERVLNQFPAGASRFWIAADPDDILLDETILSELHGRGFELVEYEDPIAFRLVFETERAGAQDTEAVESTRSLLLHFRHGDASMLPADYLAAGRLVSLSLADLFPCLSYPVVRQIDRAKLGVLFDRVAQFASQGYGEQATKDFVLLHVYELSPQLITSPAKLWSAVLRLHNSSEELPEVLARHVAAILTQRPAFERLPIAAVLSSRTEMLRVVQLAWERHLAGLGLTGTRIGEGAPSDAWDVHIPFDDPEVHVYVDSLFLAGALHPVLLTGAAEALPAWARVGVLPDPMALSVLVTKGIARLAEAIPGPTAPHRVWGAWAQQLGELLSRSHALTVAQAATVTTALTALRTRADQAFWQWCVLRLPTLASIPSAPYPAMLHRTVDFLAGRRAAGERRVALVVFDGMALDQWATLREELMKGPGRFAFDEGTSFAWLPTLTSVSRQAIFSGVIPRHFADSIDGTSAESALWSRAWQDRGLKLPEVHYQKGLRRTEQLSKVEEQISKPAVKVAGLVVDMIDGLIHDAKLGKRGVARLIREWCATGFVERLFDMLIAQGYCVYLTADHGNTEAVGTGKPSEGSTPDVRGERVRIYRNETLRRQAAEMWPGTLQLDLPGLPADFLPLYAAHGAAFMTAGEPAVVHGGASIEELLVPFVRVSAVSP